MGEGWGEGEIVLLHSPFERLSTDIPTPVEGTSVEGWSGL